MKPSLVLALLTLSLTACSTKPGCDATSCTGCCDSAGACQPGFNQTSCGQFGASCDVCVGLQLCQLGRCTLPEGGGSGGGGGGGGGSTGGGTGGGSVGGGGGGTSLGPCGMRGECATGVCNRPTNTCVTCRSPVDCDDGLVCTGGACVSATSCTSDLDCTPSGKVCDTNGGRCVQCKGSAECATGQACVGFACAPVLSCMSSLDCTARKQVCAPATPPRFPATVTQACQDCATNNDCPMGNECRSGTCVDACGPRVCGSVSGVDCGTCPLMGPFGGPSCLDTGRACLSLVAFDSNSTGSGVSAAFVSGALMWTERSPSGSVLALNLTSGLTETVSTGDVYPEGVGATSTTYYWGSQGGIFQRARSGGNRSLAAGFTSPDDMCTSLAVAPGQLYCGGDSFTPGSNGVYRAPLGGGVPLNLLFTENSAKVLNHGPNVFFLGDSRLGFHDAVAGTTTFLSTHNGAIHWPLFADDQAVYFWRSDTTVLKKIDLATRVETVLYTPSFDEYSLVAGVSDGVHAYLLISASNTMHLRKVNLASGAVITLAEDFGQIGPSPEVVMQLDSTTLLIGSPGFVLRVAPR